jgi:site-specific DNA-methyltransferase (adenine-specific)
MMIQADVLSWCKSYEGDKFHALLCDPPYELGFMGRSWDKTGIAFQPSTWAALAEHLHDGAFIMAFASSRGWHRQAVAMEDAGLIMHPSIFGWAYGSGFPKATRGS